MAGVRRPFLPLIVLTFAVSLAQPCRAERTWLGWFNGTMFAFNRSVAETLDGIAGQLPPGSSAIGQGVQNFASTWIGEPLNAGAYVIAGKPGEAGFALQRMAVNVTTGWLGVVDRAAEWGMASRPTDYGLALCAQGVPAGPFIVIPLTGVRTARDFAADWVVARVMLYGTVFGILQMPLTVGTLVFLEVAEEVATFAVAGAIGEVPADAQADRLDVAEERYLAGRERLCSELAQR